MSYKMTHKFLHSHLPKDIAQCQLASSEMRKGQQLCENSVYDMHTTSTLLLPQISSDSNWVLSVLNVC